MPPLNIEILDMANEMSNVITICIIFQLQNNNGQYLLSLFFFGGGDFHTENRIHIYQNFLAQTKSETIDITSNLLNLKIKR